MTKWLAKYQKEAVECDSIALASLLNPRFRGKFFEVHYPEYHSSAISMIEDAFAKCVELGESEEREPTPTPDNDTTPPEIDDFDVFGVASSGTYKSSKIKLEEYLQGTCIMKKDQTPLGWWKVSSFSLLLPLYLTMLTLVVLVQEHQHRFPILAKLARDYLSVSATSCACERTFSAAADVCTPSRGGMLPKTMERLVGSQAWLKEGIIPDGDFAEAAKALQALIDSVGKKKKK